MCKSFIVSNAHVGFKIPGSADLLAAVPDARLRRVEFAFMIACASAWTGVSPRSLAREKQDVYSGVHAFADAMGPNIAYVGFVWAMQPELAYDIARDFLGFLEGNITLRAALVRLDTEGPPPSRNWLRLLGTGQDRQRGLDRPVDARYLPPLGPE